MSLVLLLHHLDSAVWGSHVVLSRMEQQEYLGGRVPSVDSMTVIRRAGKVDSLPIVNPMITFLERRCRAVARAVHWICAVCEMVFVVLPYAVRLYRHGRRHAAALIHQNNGFDVGAILAARMLKVPIVAYQRGAEWNSFLTGALAPTVDAYIANSEATKANLMSLGVDASEICVIYPPVDLAACDGAKRSALSHGDFGVTSSSPCFGIVGILQEAKGHRVFLQAARLVIDVLPDAHAWVIGGAPAGGEAYEEELRLLARRLGIEKNVVFTGFRPDVLEVVRLLDVVVQPSLSFEGFGRTIAEAMALGKPVIASDASGPKEIIAHGRTGFLVPPGDAHRFAEAIVMLLRDRELAQRMAEGGCREVARRFSTKLHATAVQRIYTQVLERAGRMPMQASCGTHVGISDVTQSEIR